MDLELGNAFLIEQNFTTDEFFVAIFPYCLMYILPTIVFNMYFVFDIWKINNFTLYMMIYGIYKIGVIVVWGCMYLKKHISLRGLNIPNKKRAMAQNIYILTAMFIISTIFCIAGDYILGTKTYDIYLRYEFIYFIGVYFINYIVYVCFIIR